MADRRSAPQSHGSQTVNRVKDNPNTRSGDFYANGQNQVRAEEDDEETLPKVTSQPSGAKRDSFFKKRDY